MILSGGVLTLALTVLAAQGSKSGSPKHKVAPPRAEPANAPKRSAPPTAARARVAPAPRHNDTATAGTRAPRDDDAQTATAAPAAGTTADEGDGASGSAAGPPGKATKTKVYTFGAMDVEGKLKTPQLLYFLNRVKLELEMSAPDHRSFMKELEKTAEDPNL